MKKILLICSLSFSLLISGCVRTYRMEQASIFNNQINTDGTTSCCHHTEGAEREWYGFWPFPPTHVRP